MNARVCGGAAWTRTASETVSRARTRIRIRRVYDFDAMLGTAPRSEKPVSISMTASLGGAALFVAGCLMFLQRSCFDRVIKTPVDLEHKGVAVFDTIEFN